MATIERPLSEFVPETIARTYIETFGTENPNLSTVAHLPNLLVEHSKEQQEGYLKTLLGPNGLNMHNSDQLSPFLIDVLNASLRVRVHVSRFAQMQKQVDSFAYRLGLSKKAASFVDWGFKRSYYGQKLEEGLTGLSGLASEYRREWEVKIARSLGASFGSQIWPDSGRYRAHAESIRDVADATSWVSLDDLMEERGYEGNPLIPIVNMRLAGFQPVGLQTRVLGAFYYLDTKGEDGYFTLSYPKVSFNI